VAPGWGWIAHLVIRLQYLRLQSLRLQFLRLQSLRLQSRGTRFGLGGPLSR